MSMPPPSEALAQDFVHFAVRCGVLRFGEFKTKAGRLSPYFFNKVVDGIPGFWNGWDAM